MKSSPDAARISRPFSTLVPSRRSTMGTSIKSSFAAATIPAASTSTFRMPPNMLMRIALTFGSERMIRNPFLIWSLSAPRAHVEKVGGHAPRVLDDVHGGHREACAVHHAADVPVELDVVEPVVDCVGLERFLLVEVAQFGQVRVPEQSVVVDVQLGVEGNRPAVLGEDERIDFDHGSVRLAIGPRESLDRLDRGRQRRAADAQAERHAPRLEGAQTPARDSPP